MVVHLSVVALVGEREVSLPAPTPKT